MKTKCFYFVKTKINVGEDESYEPIFHLSQISLCTAYKEEEAPKTRARVCLWSTFISRKILLSNFC